MFESKPSPEPVPDAWEPAPAKPVLDGGEVHIWRASLAQPDSAIEAFARLLAPEEAERAKRFVFKRDGDRFVVARGMLRSILGNYLEQAPDRVAFTYGEHGKPLLESPHDFFFNVSHSKTMAVFAFGKGRQLGVDVEYIRRDLDAKAIATRFFSPSEIAKLNTLPERLQIEGFFNCWTRKEAYLKARGEGIFFGLDNFDVSLVPGEPAALLRVEGEPAELSRWTFTTLRVHADYAAAAVVEGKDWCLRCWDYEGNGR